MTRRRKKKREGEGGKRKRRKEEREDDKKSIAAQMPYHVNLPVIQPPPLDSEPQPLSKLTYPILPKTTH